MASTTRKIIPQAEADGIDQWVPPSMGSVEDISDPGALSGPLTAAQIQKIHDQAQQDGYDAGYQEGLQRGMAEGMQAGESQAEALLLQLNQLLEHLVHPLNQVDDYVEEALVTLAMSVGQHLVRRELKTNPAQVIAVVREAVAALPVAAPQVNIFLHPEDAALIRERLTVSENESQWQLVEDPAISRGGCRVVSEASEVDATVQTRVAQVVAKVMGDERDG